MNRAAAVEVAAQAKINLRLRVLAREATGYHQIETLFLRIALADVVRVHRTTGERSLDVTGDVDLTALGPTEKNLAWRAAVALADATEWRGGFAIEIEKHIPIGGGLGGGSADAGAVLRAMNALTDAPLDTLLDLAAPLGADVPFFASESAYALAWGRGERMLALHAPPERDLLLVIPEFGVDTAAAYGWVDEDAERRDVRCSSQLFDFATLSEWRTLASACGNDFEWVVGQRHPQVVELVEALAGRDTEIAQLTGSGSTIFGVIAAGANVDAVEQRLAARGARTIRSRTATHVEPVVPVE